MKKTLSLILALIMVLGLAACGGSPAKTTENAQTKAADDFSWGPATTELVVPFAPGGGTDLAARMIAEGMSKVTGKNFIVTNQTDGGGAIAYNNIASGKADCSTIGFFIGSYFSTYWTGIHDYEPVKDIQQAATLKTVGTTNFFVVRKDAKWNTLEELLEDIRKNPGTIKYGMPTAGINYFQSFELKDLWKIEGVKYVDAAGDSEKVTGLLGGTIDFAGLNANQASQYVASGDLKPLAAMEAYDKEKTPEVLWNTPTLEELGLAVPKCQANIFYIGASSAVSEETLKQLNKIVAAALELDSVKEGLAKASIYITPMSYEDGLKNFTEANQTYHDVAAEAGILAANRK